MDMLLYAAKTACPNTPPNTSHSRDFTTHSWQFSIFLSSFLLTSLGTMELNLRSAILGYINFLLTSPSFKWSPIPPPRWWHFNASWQGHAVGSMKRTSHYIFRHLLLPVRFACLLKSCQADRCFCCFILEHLCCALV